MAAAAAPTAASSAPPSAPFAVGTSRGAVTLAALAAAGFAAAALARLALSRLGRGALVFAVRGLRVRGFAPRALRRDVEPFGRLGLLAEAFDAVIGGGRLAPSFAGLRRRARDLGTRIGRSQDGAHDAVGRKPHRLVGLEDDAEIVPRLDLGEGDALLVEDVQRHRGRHRHGHLDAALAEAFFLDRAQHAERHRFGGADIAGAHAVRTLHHAGFDEARPEA